MLNDRIYQEALRERCVVKLARTFDVPKSQVIAALRERGFSISRNGYAVAKRRRSGRDLFQMATYWAVAAAQLSEAMARIETERGMHGLAAVYTRKARDAEQAAAVLMEARDRA